MERIAICAVAIAAFTGCDASGAAGPHGRADVLGSPAGDPPTVLVAEGESEAWPSDPVEIREASVRDDVLTLRVRYGGGCVEHDFALVVEEVFLESHPVQMPARLSHDAHGDLCRALVAATLRFDLAPVKEAYLSVYGADPGALILRLPDRRIRYPFGASRSSGAPGSSAGSPSRSGR